MANLDVALKSAMSIEGAIGRADALIRKVDGLSDKDTRTASTVSSLSLLSLLKHSASWECR